MNNGKINVTLDLKDALRMYQRGAQQAFEKSGSEFKTYSGVEFRILDFGPEHVRLEDIAHGLGNVCRYAGQCGGFYSVAEHSVLTSRYVEQMSRIPGIVETALLHDASEAYLADVPTPVKILCPGYQMIEELFEDVIAETFGLGFGFRHPVVRECDFRMYLRERPVLMVGEPQSPPSDLDDLLRIRFLPPKEAERAFLERAEELGVAMRQ